MMNTREVSEYLSFSVVMVQRAVRAGELKAEILPGRKYRYSIENVDSFRKTIPPLSEPGSGRFTVKDASVKTGVCAKTLSSHIKMGLLPARLYRVYRASNYQYEIEPDDLEVYSRSIKPRRKRRPNGENRKDDEFKPVPVRHFNCESYGGCLDVAARKNGALSCEGCNQLRIKRLRPDW